MKPKASIVTSLHSVLDIKMRDIAVACRDSRRLQASSYQEPILSEAKTATSFYFGGHVRQSKEEGLAESQRDLRYDSVLIECF